MIELYVVISIWHSQKRDHTFVHGIFDELTEAEKIEANVINDRSFIENEGYDLRETEGLSTYISKLPYCQRVNDYVPMTV
jgi:hypothetical protein